MVAIFFYKYLEKKKLNGSYAKKLFKMTTTYPKKKNQ